MHDTTPNNIRGADGMCQVKMGENCVCSCKMIVPDENVTFSCFVENCFVRWHTQIRAQIVDLAGT